MPLFDGSEKSYYTALGDKEEDLPRVYVPLIVRWDIDLMYVLHGVRFSHTGPTHSAVE